MKSKLLAVLAFILSAPASATALFDNPAIAVEEHPNSYSVEASNTFLFFAQPGFSFSHITFLAETDVRPLPAFRQRGLLHLRRF
jgi:hypothetical protein